MNRIAAGLFIVGLLIFFASAATLLRPQQAAAPAPRAQPADAPPSVAAEPLLMADVAANRYAEAERVNDNAAKARERRDAQERALQAGYQDDVRQLRMAQERQAQQVRAIELAEQTARQQQQIQARWIAAEQAARQVAEQDRQMQHAKDQQQHAKDQQAQRVQRMLEQNWLYWRYPMPRLPSSTR